MKPLKIAIVVQGRFHAFDLARVLLARGHAVTVFTNYPPWAAARFGVPVEHVRSFATHAFLERAASRLARTGSLRYPEAWLHQMFGRWAAREVAAGSWDVVHCWSGVSEEILSVADRRSLTLLMRGSAHIAEQSRLLRDEETRAGVALDRPSGWMIARELREYALADHIVVLSTFSRTSFQGEGIRDDKISVLPLGVDVAAFRPSADVIEARKRRILAGEPLRVLYVGSVSYQKGLVDLAATIDALDGEPFHFVLVGRVLPEAASLVERLRARAEIVGHVAQARLPAMYADADLFVFPTIQDGFGVVLAQAKAAGLPIVTTPHGAGPDMVTPDRDGWIVPIRDGAAIVERLRWCRTNRPVLAAMTTRVYDTFRPRDWTDVAADFEALCGRLLVESPVLPVGATC
jgi:glycosyltransferase involved in cell wall biosynthesis